MIKKKCEVCGNKVHGRYKRKGTYFCSKHYVQMRRHGRILERTRFDNNEIIDCKEYFEMCLYNKYGEERTRAKFSKNQLNKVNQYKWRNSNGYIATHINRKTLFLHQLILTEKKGFEIDHINHDKLDNRNENLRFVTVSQNQMNRKGVLGISWYKNEKKWIASIMVNNKRIYLGMFIKKENAIKVRKKAEKNHFGEFRYQGVE